VCNGVTVRHAVTAQLLADYFASIAQMPPRILMTSNGPNTAADHVVGVQGNRSDRSPNPFRSSQVLTIPIVAGEVDPDWPTESLPDEKREEMVAWMAAGMARSYKFFAAHRRASAWSENQEQTYRRSAPKVGRNDRCPCGSRKKFRHCCGASQSL
jgi:SEC-C motif